ncbi:MAG: type II toxin-antitoxin system HicB family antitoxin [Alphaproteobacteria bacterium]|nr:type II toxin-antitoxin system HicB family antitoxin [Alphaproteobacteria bacterium]
MNATKAYIAIIEGGDTPGYSVFFPDLPGCASGGDTIDEAIGNAHEALNLHLSGMAADNDPIPEPSPFEDIEVDPEVREVARVLIPAEISGRTVRLNISLDEGIVALADRKATARGYTRSGYIAALIRDDATRSARHSAPAAKSKAKPKRRRAG